MLGPTSKNPLELCGLEGTGRISGFGLLERKEAASSEARLFNTVGPPQTDR